MRDLKRANAKQPAYKELSDRGFEVFTPMKWMLTTRQGQKKREEIPVVRDLLFVHSSSDLLDPIVKEIPTLQYRFLRGGHYCEPMIVRDTEMRRFIDAVNSTDKPVYYQPEEITPAMCGRSIRVVGGPLDGYEGRLLKVRGTRKRRIIVDLPGILSVSVEVAPEWIQVL